MPGLNVNAGDKAIISVAVIGGVIVFYLINRASALVKAPVDAIQNASYNTGKGFFDWLYGNATTANGAPVGVGSDGAVTLRYTDAEVSQMAATARANADAANAAAQANGFISSNDQFFTAMNDAENNTSPYDTVAGMGV